MTPQEKRRRRRQWDKLIARWKAEPMDRSAWQVTTWDDNDDSMHNMADRPVKERVEYLMRLRWMNYGPDALYGRLERVYSIGTLASAEVPDRRRRRSRPARPASGHQ
ncbi:MAG: hypothetical protein QM703_24865 [Gemmatales bacterium]